MNKTSLAILVTAIITLIPANTFSDDLYAQNLSIFSLSPHTDDPEIFFANNGLLTKIRQHNGVMTFHTDADNVAFHIWRTAADKALVVGRYGVGIGTTNPASALQIVCDDYTDIQDSTIQVYDWHSETKMRTMLNLSNNGPVRFELDNWKSNQTWAFQTNNADGFLINRLGSGGNEFSIRKSGMVTMGPGGKLNFVLDTAGNLHIDGTLTQSSDRDKKEEFAGVDAQEILASVTRLPITSWRYKDDQPGVRHIGPVAQDFYREFQIGKDDKTIATVDADGIALLAIQALSQRLVDQTQRLDEQIKRNDAMTTIVEDLIAAMAAKDRDIAGMENRLAQIETQVLLKTQ